MLYSWQRLQALTKMILILKEGKEGEKTQMRKFTLENGMVGWGIKTQREENMHQQTNPGPEIFQFSR